MVTSEPAGNGPPVEQSQITTRLGQLDAELEYLESAVAAMEKRFLRVVRQECAVPAGECLQKVAEEPVRLAQDLDGVIARVTTARERLTDLVERAEV